LEKDFRQIALAWQFELRDRGFGRIRLRPGLPEVPEVSTPTPEQKFYDLLLARAFTRDELSRFTSVIDIGSRNGSYLPSLARSCPNASINGIELDGGRRYWNGFRRADFGEAYVQSLRDAGRDARYSWGDAQNLSADTLRLRKEDIVLMTFFYPFVSETPCAGWGLPARYADYDTLLQRLCAATSTVADSNRFFLSAHQGEWEGDRARRVYKTMRLEIEKRRVERAEFSTLWPSEHPVILFRCRTP
jgi:hypothetical protein